MTVAISFGRVVHVNARSLPSLCGHAHIHECSWNSTYQKSGVTCEIPTYMTHVIYLHAKHRKKSIRADLPNSSTLQTGLFNIHVAFSSSSVRLWELSVCFSAHSISWKQSFVHLFVFKAAADSLADWRRMFEGFITHKSFFVTPAIYVSSSLCVGRFPV